MKTLPHKDVVVVGLGWAGSLMANELSMAGLSVVAIERGAKRDTSTDYPTDIDTDELRFSIRREIMQPLAVETLSFRNNVSQTALPLRDWNCFQFGWGTGGAGSHWNGMTWRFLEADHTLATTIKNRYGNKKLADGLIIQDWGVTSADLEPFYDKFERYAGTSGKAGNIQGNKIPGGNVFEAPRSRDYPLGPLHPTPIMDAFEQATAAMGLHPFTVPAGNTSGAYTNPLGIHMAPCTYCGYCEFYGCGNWSKSSPQACLLPAVYARPNFSLITEAEVLQVELTADKKMAKGVTLIDKDGNLCFQPADIVILSAYQMDNVRLMLLSGIGKPYDRDAQTGVVGRDYSYQTISSSTIFMPDDFIQNPFVGAGALAKSVDDFNSDNFDHSNYDFIGGANIVVHSTGGRPIARGDAVPAGTKRWGSEWKQQFKTAYQASNSLYAQGTSHGHRDVFLDLDPTYRDRLGRPLLRVTFDWNENDKKSAHFISDRCEDIARAMKVKSHIRNEPTAKPFTPMTNLSSHTIGGAVMGDDPNTSALNRYLQSWDVANVFVPGANAFANNGGYNPTGTVGALTLWSAQHIINQYLKAPGALVQA